MRHANWFAGLSSGAPGASAIVRDDAALLKHIADHGIPFVVIGGWAVISHGFVRNTKDVDLLVPDRDRVHAASARAMSALGARHRNGTGVVDLDDRIPDQGWQLTTSVGDVDFLLEGVPPLDFATVDEVALDNEMGDVPFRFAALESLVAFKRLAGRPQDRVDLAELEAIHGPLPIVRVPGLDP